MTIARAAALMTLCAGLAVTVSGQATDSLSVEITSPEAGSYVGLTPLRADVTPPTGVTSVTFFVDGRQTCTVAQPPFECAGTRRQTIVEHQVRVVASRAAGPRRAHVRPKASQYTRRSTSMRSR